MSSHLKRLAFLLTLVLSTGFLNAQSLYTALRLNQKNNHYKGSPSVVTETNTFYSKNGKEVEVSVKKFDEAGLLQQEQRFEDNKLTAQLTYTYEAKTKLKLSRRFERFHPLLGNTAELSTYQYDDANRLSSMTDTDMDGNILFLSKVSCDEKGNPIHFTVYNGNGKAMGHETASYDYDSNLVVNTAFGPTGEITSTDTAKVDFNLPALGGQETYNERGDLTHYTLRNKNGTATTYEHEYKYDDIGNCTLQKIYVVTSNKKGKQKRKIDRVFAKAYTY